MKKKQEDIQSWTAKGWALSPEEDVWTEEWQAFLASVVLGLNPVLNIY